MLKVKPKLTVNMSGVSAKLSKIAKDEGLGNELADQAAIMMDKYVPYRAGILSGSVQHKPFKVTYNTPYARRMFYGKGYKFSTDQHLNATARWDEAFKADGGSDKLGKVGTDYLKGK